MTAANPTGCALARPHEIPCKEFTVIDTESALELAIEAAHAKLLTVPWEARTAAWEEFSALVKQRSVHRVRFLERMRGLA